MTSTNDQVKFLPSHWRVGGSVVLALLLAVQTWLYLRSESVSTAQHFSYTQNLRDLRELDAEIDGELLANRLELTRNYDALTDFVQRAVVTSGMTLATPSYLSVDDKATVLSAAQNVQAIYQQKAELIDGFKRNNAVLRNSMAFFPVAAGAFLDGDDARLPAHHRLVDQYVRVVLVYARAPSEPARQRIAEARARVAAVSFEAAARSKVHNLLRHGDVITQRLSTLDQLMQGIFALHSNEQVDKLNRDYGAGHARALADAGRYRMATYALDIFLVAYLALAFFGLDRARRSLEVAHREISDRYSAQLAAEKKLKLHATAFNSAHDGITLTDAQGAIVDINPAFSRITGFERSEVIGRNPRVLKSGRHDPDFYAAMWRSIKETGSWSGEIWNRNKYGEVYPELLSISAVHDEAGQLTNYVAVFADIRRIKDQERQLKQMAYYDLLTELPNRALLADRVVQAIAQARRSQTMIAICYLDLDGFKPVNDIWGHDAGDKVLVEIANRLKDALRGGDTVARLGGDEFVLLLLGLTNPQECDEAMLRLLNRIAQPMSFLPEPVSLSASIGVTLFPGDDADPDTLLRHADQAMYQAKQAGKNRHHIFDAEQDRFARSRYDRVDRIRQALEDQEFLLYYQPKVNMRLGTVIGAEALIRWNHPERGIVPPAEFLPLIEDDELIKLVGDWVIETALTQMEIWRAEGLNLPVSVNVAGKQLQSPAFVEKLKVALFLHPDVAHQLELEVLETAALEDVVKSARVIDECRAMGVHFALDDFGTGYSSLTYLKRLPAETIKIDQSFVREILSDWNNLVIVQGVIGLANAFQRQVIAEGVETVDHGRLLMQLNCDQAQGYGIAKPMPAELMVDWVRDWRGDPLWAQFGRLTWEDADYPLLIAEVDHRNWVAQLVYAIKEGQPAPHASLDDAQRCRFGQWYHGHGKRRYGALPAYARIDPPHLLVHQIASRIDAHWRDGQMTAARALIPELLAARDATLTALSELQLACGVVRAGV
ncbi:EAL domain-containing protein [Dechloromonas sp. HYN0024]|uniref:EAL domain-containing protein n=1 Tax=Dechloromonas sp. HYN0024 TaxID=2231055 RepID=UPI000E45252E|nr:EAL domain-containing protein [Dechloromonas sp. HYN0024]AXS80322.1 EAL domain-containing protein [Dechloromonas sp. HYN0024]